MSKARARQILRETWGQRQGLTQAHLEEIERSMTIVDGHSMLRTLCRIGETKRPIEFVPKPGETRTADADPCRDYFRDLPDD